MAKVRAHRFIGYDIMTDREVLSSCWATRTTIEHLDGCRRIAPGTEIEVDVAVLNGNGMTPSGFCPCG
jgi:hypothetical protein